MNFRVPYLVGNVLSRDHQYWPTITHADFVAKLIAQGQPPGDAEAYVTSLEYFPTDLKMMMALSWRVREWTVSAGSFSWSGIDPSSNPWSMAGSWSAFIVKTYRVDLADYLSVVDERNILGPSSDFQGSALNAWRTLRNAGVGAFQDSGIVTGTVTQGVPALTTPAGGSVVAVCFSYLVGPGFVIYNPDSKLFYPPFSAGAGCTETGNAFDPPRVVIGFNTGVTAGSFTLVGAQGGASITKTNKIQGYHGAILDAAGSGSVSDITMTATKWWPYSNSQGLPVYDEITGDVVNNPFA